MRRTMSNVPRRGLLGLVLPHVAQELVEHLVELVGLVELRPVTGAGDHDLAELRLLVVQRVRRLAVRGVHQQLRAGIRRERGQYLSIVVS